ncbi:chorismate synthase [uncultured Desulfobacter sp.]|uniref:chorismate synthase n=1 Tax=uncultured Desulfobacter sp. TaxID=240139 RepID=UPI002AA6E965|nr:chorismate synthase [uncultured Desulfobacter sp.]
MSSSFGRLFRVSTFGESHCPGVGVVVDGCLPGMSLREPDIQCQLDRRRPGQSAVSTDRQEPDQVTIQSGTEHGLTLGTPISLFVPNKDHRPGDYKSMADIPRPSHADFTYQSKYGIRASSGGGRSSARETIGRVCAGAIAEKMLNTALGINIVAWVSQVGEIKAPETDGLNLTRAMVDASMIRCPDADAAKAMEEVVLKAKEDKDSIGGVVSCVCTNVPAGLGEPIFDKLEALLAHAMLSIPATKGFEIGSGFTGAQMRGSEHNDPFVKKDGRLGTTTNFSGGIQGGISNGEPIAFKVAFKPPATIGIVQETADFKGQQATLEAKGRHDPCVVARAVPIVESMAALVLADVMLQQQARLAGMALMNGN